MSFFASRAIALALLVAPLVALADEAPAADPYAWLPANAGSSRKPISLGAFAGELRIDAALHYSAAQPQDDTIGGSSEVFRHGEAQLTHIGFGGSIEHERVQARLLLQLGLYSQSAPNNDASVARGQWRLDQALRYVSEAYVGYQLDVLHGINLQAGLFMSYIGLWSYYNFDNWTYQPSYVSSNTPWFFSGVRAQIFISEKLKVEPWLINGWQSYGRFNQAPGVGMQISYRPTTSLAMVENFYVGTDTPSQPRRVRVHNDASVMFRYLNRPNRKLSKAAVSVTFDAGFESGAGVGLKDQYFLGAMAYHRMWGISDHIAWTVGGGLMRNPGRYLVLLPPINGATATTGSPYFSATAKDPFFAWDVQATFDWLPAEFATLRLEFTHRSANVAYFAGPGGMTPPGGNTGTPGVKVDGWAPDLRRSEDRATLALLCKF